ncbi:MAG: alpha/beta family hydrolase [Vicinamibacterales bacterium]
MLIDGPIGRLEARLDAPTGAVRAAVVLASPNPQLGGTMLSRVVHEAARGLTRIGCATLRFNFRGAGLSEGSHDGGAGERRDFAAALDFLAARYPATPLWAAGYSFGAWVALVEGATDPRVDLLIGIAPPVESYDFSPVLEASKPVFLVQGDRDELCSLGATRRFYAQLDEPKEIAIVDGADHLFDSLTAEVGDALVDLLGDYESGGTS